jgi:CheY-like chemotaxis protein
MNAATKLAPKKPMSLARVLLADDNVMSRLTLQTLLEAGGYRVDSAASAAEAMEKLDNQEYDLVLTDREMETADSGLRVLAHARTMDYEPATAIFESESDAEDSTSRKPMLVATEDVPGLLGKVADLISRRATRQVSRELKMAG